MAWSNSTGCLAGGCGRRECKGGTGGAGAQVLHQRAAHRWLTAAEQSLPWCTAETTQLLELPQQPAALLSPRFLCPAALAAAPAHPAPRIQRRLHVQYTGPRHLSHLGPEWPCSPYLIFHLMRLNLKALQGDAGRHATSAVCPHNAYYADMHVSLHLLTSTSGFQWSSHFVAPGPTWRRSARQHESARHQSAACG